MMLVWTVTVPFNYYVVSPVLSNGWVFLGETSKYVTASKQRFNTISARNDDKRYVLCLHLLHLHTQLSFFLLYMYSNNNELLTDTYV